MPTTVIIGMGISAAAYLLSVSRDMGAIVTLGGSDVWQQVDPHHKMGQPAPLLTGNLLGHGRADRGFATAPRPGGGFMRAGDFSVVVQYYLRTYSQVQLPGSLVVAIRLFRGHYQIRMNVWGTDYLIEADNVILALGAGPARPLLAGDDGKIEVNVDACQGRVVGGNAFMSPTWTMPDHAKREGALVAVYGGSATASWAVELAQLRGMRVVCWFTRPGDGAKAWDAADRFEAAFPAGGRNVRVEAYFRDVRKVLKLVDVVYVGASAPYLVLTFHSQAGYVVKQVVDLLVYALGAGHTKDAGIRAMLEPAIQHRLVAFYDRNQAISPNPSLLAVGTDDQSLMIVGSAMSSSAGFGKAELKVQGDPLKNLGMLAPYSGIANTLPPAARPTEGIAMIMAGIEALNQFMPATANERVGARVGVYRTPTYTTAAATGGGQLPRGSVNPGGGEIRFHHLDFDWDINYNTSNRTQLAAYLAQTTDLSPFAANIAVALIVRLRTRDQNVLGLSDEQVRIVMRVAEDFGRQMALLNPRLEEIRLQSDKGNGADRYLDICVDHMTTAPGYVGYWRRCGVNC